MIKKRETALKNLGSNDKEVVLAAVKQNGIALQYASAELRADKDVVLAAVQKDGEALQYASDELRADKEVVFAAAKNNRAALRYARYNLRIVGEDIVLSFEGGNGDE